MDKNWRKKLAILWLAQFVGMCAITGLISFLPLYVSHLGITDTAEAAMWAGVLIGAASFCAAVSNPFWGALADRKGRKPMVEKVLFMFGIIMIAMAFATNVYQLFILRILQGLCGGFVAAATALAITPTPTARATVATDWLSGLLAPVRSFIDGIALLVRRTFFNQAPTVAHLRD